MEGEETGSLLAFSSSFRDRRLLDTRVCYCCCVAAAGGIDHTQSGMSNSRGGGIETADLSFWGFLSDVKRGTHIWNISIFVFDFA